MASCSMCDRKSLLMYPVRYAVACPRGAAKAPALGGNFKIDGRAPQSVGAAKYTLRAIRPGYLYTWDEKRNRLKAYLIFPDGLMWSFTPGSAPPPQDAEWAGKQCTDYKWMALGRCVDIEHTPGVDEATNLWIGWSNVQWTKTLVGNVTKEDWRKKHMQCINIPKMMGGGAADTGEFFANHEQIAHFKMSKDEMKAAFEFSNTPPKYEIDQHGDVPRISDAMAQSPNRKGFIVAVNDPVGLTNDLAELTVPNLNNGFNEGIYWKWMSAQLLGRAEQGIRARARESVRVDYAVTKDIQVANENPMGGEGVADIGLLWRVVKGTFQSGSVTKAMQDEDQRENDVPGTQKAAEDAAWEDASTTVGADGKRVSVINQKALEGFPKEYQSALDAFKPSWQPLVQAHAGWLNSKLLADWMAGVHDDADMRSGFAYSESCAQSIGAAAGTDQCTKVLNDWLNQGTLSDTRNIYARALMFNQQDLMSAAASQVHGSDIQYENFIQIYKKAFQRLPKNGQADKLFDRLVLTTGNVIVETLTKAARGVAWGVVTIRLALHSGETIKQSKVSKLALRDWMLQNAKDLGVDLDGTRTERRENATQVAKQTLKTTPVSDPDVVVYELDTDALQRTGKLEGTVKGIKLPGAATTREWLGSSAPAAFHQGVATAIFQMVALVFATKDLSGSDRFNKDENERKLAACIVSIVGNIIETAAETVAKAETHPLSAYILKQWANAERYSEIGKYGGRAIGSIAGLVLAGYDLFKNAPEAFHAQEYGLSALYVASGILGAYVAVAAFFGTIPFFWPVLVASILIGIAIALYKGAELKAWISRCKFSKSEYHTLNEELDAYNSAAGG